MENFDIVFFELDNGDCPIREYLDSVDVKMRAKIAWTIGLLEKNGNMLGMPYFEPLEDGIFELRTKLSSNISKSVIFFLCREKNNTDKRFYKENKQIT